MITRRRVLGQAAAFATGWAGVWTASRPVRAVGAQGVQYENPYAGVDWDRWEWVPSMSHQHQGLSDDSRDLFLGMGYRHFAFSNYYPSIPTYPLPADWQNRHPKVLASPNAEQHSFLDSGLHANSLGSFFSSGYGSSIPTKHFGTSPISRRFSGLNPFHENTPWQGVYRLDLQIEPKSGSASAMLSITGARECLFRDGFPEKPTQGPRQIPAGKHAFYLRAESDSLTVDLEFDPIQIRVKEFRLMQGTNRPWREVFRAVLDGELVEGQRRGGLQFADGGGITLNHPVGKMSQYLPMLDFDSRVLGIEVWNQLTSGFGSARGFEAEVGGAHDHFYRLWDEILATGRRCWGFFVKDHNTYGRGRNVLLLPPLSGLSRAEREAEALKAYRKGSFIGAVSAIATDAMGRVIPPYDCSAFRFRHLRMVSDKRGRPRALEAAVCGQDSDLRPNVQIRFVSEKGVVAVIDGAEGEWQLPYSATGEAEPLFIRVEAIAYPSTCDGKPLTPEEVRGMGMAELAALHDRWAGPGPTFFGNPVEVRTQVPVVDLIFSQPLRRV